MPINPDSVGTVGEESQFSWTSKDSLLYALSIGAGATDPTGAELEFTTENTSEVTQRAFPTIAVVLGGVAGTGPDFGSFDLTSLVHGEQSVSLHTEIPVAGRAYSSTRVKGIYDKGKAALVVLESNVRSDDGPLWTNTSSLFIRGEGGWGGERGPSDVVAVEIPDRAPDTTTSATTRTDQALLYRLNGDRNPLHSDPSFAAMAGFPKPILHGLCTYGFTGRLLLHAVCGSDPARFKGMEGRFSTPVMPGDKLDVEIWNIDDTASVFQTKVGESVVIASGRLTHS